MNKTRVDNFPPLQDLSVFEKSFEARRKQTTNFTLRSRSKNYRNLESGSYVNANNHEKNPATAKSNANDDSFADEKSVESNTLSFKEKYKHESKLTRKTGKKIINSNDVIVTDSSISMTSGAANHNKERGKNTDAGRGKSGTIKLQSRHKPDSTQKQMLSK